MSKAPPCESYADDWSAYLDGELSANRAALLRAHLLDCDVCTRRLEALRAADAVLRADLATTEVPSDLRARLQTRIDTDSVTSLATAREQRGLPTRLRAPVGAGLLAAAAAAAVYLAVSRETPLTPDPGLPEQRVATQEDRTPPGVPVPPPEPSDAPAPPEQRVAMQTPTIDPSASADPKSVGAPEAPLDAASEEELAVALELETIEDLDVIANLDLLEALVLLEEGTG